MLKVTIAGPQDSKKGKIADLIATVMRMNILHYRGVAIRHRGACWNDVDGTTDALITVKETAPDKKLRITFSEDSTKVIKSRLMLAVEEALKFGGFKTAVHDPMFSGRVETWKGSPTGESANVLLVVKER